jgi:hypothetical protein
LQAQKPKFKDLYTKIDTKLDSYLVEEIRDQVKLLPTLTALDTFEAKIESRMKVFSDMNKKWARQFSQHLEVVARYDEVMCEKANKHAVTQVQEFCERKITELTRFTETKLEFLSKEIEFNRVAAEAIPKGVEASVNVQLIKHARQMTQETDNARIFKDLREQLCSKADKQTCVNLQNSTIKREEHTQAVNVLSLVHS